MYRLLILFACVCYVHLIPLSQFSLVQDWVNKNGISSSDLVLVIADGRYIDAVANRNFEVESGFFDLLERRNGPQASLQAISESRLAG